MPRYIKTLRVKAAPPWLDLAGELGGDLEVLAAIPESGDGGIIAGWCLLLGSDTDDA